MTMPHSARRFCSLFAFFAYTTPATRARHPAATKYFFITDLHGQNFVFRRLLLTINWLKNFQHVSSREGAALPDSQAGCYRVLSYEAFLCGNDDQHNSAH